MLLVRLLFVITMGLTGVCGGVVTAYFSNPVIAFFGGAGVFLFLAGISFGVEIAIHEAGNK